MRRIDYLVLHCSATREGDSLSPEALEEAHRLRGFRCTGYHFYIRRDGTTVGTRPLKLVGAHVQGYNKHSIGICYEGGLDAAGRAADTRTSAQRSALRLLVSRLLRRFPNARVCGHRDLSPDLNGNGRVEPHEWLKQCPCFDVATEL